MVCNIKQYGQKRSYRGELEQRLEIDERVSQVDKLGKNIPGRVKSQYKGLGTECPEGLSSCQEASVIEQTERVGSE